MNRRKFLGLAAAAPLVVAHPTVRDQLERVFGSGNDGDVRLGQQPMLTEYSPYVWVKFPEASPWIIKTRTLTIAEVRALYPDNHRVVPHPRRRLNPPADSKSVSSERAPG